MTKKNIKSAKELEKLLDSFSSSTHSPKGKFTAEESFKLLNNKLSRTKHKSSIYIKYISIAASIIIILGISGMFYYNVSSMPTLTIQTLAETKQVFLPDGTMVILNHYSKLTYPEIFKKGTREVILSGEGYFEVTKNKEKPFIVHTTDINVKVLGTHFNITAYPQDIHIETTLLEGSVMVSNQSETEKTILRPNESAIYNKLKAKLNHEKELNASEAIVWKEGTILFNSQPLCEITQTLSNRFNTKIEITDTSLKKYRITACFNNNESLKQILDLLQPVGHFTYEYNENAIKLKPN